MSRHFLELIHADLSDFIDEAKANPDFDLIAQLEILRDSLINNKVAA